MTLRTMAQQKKDFKHSDDYLNIFSISPKGSSPSPDIADVPMMNTAAMCSGKDPRAKVSTRAAHQHQGQAHRTACSPERAQVDPGSCCRKHEQAAAWARGIQYQLSG